jgi:mannose-6-phosphate isomerase-like protein (cupin superfamily)
MKKGFAAQIEQDTIKNSAFRKVVYTGEHMQLVLMSLNPNQDIGMEVHPTNDQFFRIEKGMGKCIINGNEYPLEDGVAIVVPAGAEHNIINTSDVDELKLYTIYAPAHHKADIVRITKEEAVSREEEFDGKTTE